MAFKMKGSPMKRNFGIGVESPIKQYVRKEKGTDGLSELKGMDYIDFSSASGSNIPSFRDIVSLEQQQAVSKKLGDRRRDEREYKDEIKEAGLKRNIFGKLTGDVFGGKKVRERRELIKDLKARTPEEIREAQHRKDQDEYWSSEEGKARLKKESDEGGDVDNQDPANESSDQDIFDTIKEVEEGPNVNRVV